MVRVTWSKRGRRRKRDTNSPTENDPDLKWGCAKMRSSRPRKKRAALSQKTFYLRPVDGKGLLPISLDAGKPTIIGSDTALGTTSEHVLKEHVEVTLEMSSAPSLRVVAAFCAVYIKDPQGCIKRVPHEYEMEIYTGSVLYLAYDSRRGEPLFGYILTEDTRSKNSASSGEHDIVILDSDTDCEASGDTVVISDSDTEENSDYQDPVLSSWRTIERENLNRIPVRNARFIAKTLGVDTSGFVERSDFANALEELKVIGRAEWLLRRKKAEEARMAQRKKELQVLRQRKKLEGQKQKAVQKVKSLAKNANLKTFLNRIGIDVRPPFNMGNLKKAYKKAMLKYHPDRTVMQSEYDRFLAEEITKWITHAWNELN